VGIKASKEYFEFVKKHEQLRLTAYKDPARGILTIGYGSTRKRNVALGTITEEQALQFLDEDIAEKERIASKEITYKNLTQGQMDVIVDLYFNVRAPSRKGTIGLINKGKLDEAFVNIGKLTKAFNKDTGRMEDFGGLVTRARDRQSMWVKPNSAFNLPNANVGVNPGITQEQKGIDILEKGKKKNHGASGSFGDPIDVDQKDEAPLPEASTNDEFSDPSNDIAANAAVDSVISGAKDKKPDTLVDESNTDLITNVVESVTREKNFKDGVKKEVKRQADSNISGFKDAEAVSKFEGLDTSTIAEVSDSQRKQESLRGTPLQ